MNVIKTQLNWNGDLPYGENIPNKIVLHHAEASECSVYDIHNWHLERGWTGIGYHYLVRKDGSVYRGRDESQRGAHCPGANYNSIGICFEGSYMIEEMNDKQIEAGLELIADISSRKGKLAVYGHKELYSTDCPGVNFPLDRFKNGSIFMKENAELTSGDFIYPNNAKINGDWFYVRDKDGTVVPSRRVDDGDCITVIDVFYTKQLTLVQYPTPSGVRKGYITNSSLINYMNPYNWKNGQSAQRVYDSPNGNEIGLLNPNEKATVLYKINGWTCVVYTTNKGEFTKSGFVQN